MVRSDNAEWAGLGMKPIRKAISDREDASPRTCRRFEQHHWKAGGADQFGSAQARQSGADHADGRPRWACRSLRDYRRTGDGQR